jgi:hypothetical protein
MRIYRGTNFANLALKLAPQRVSFWLYTPPGLRLPAIAVELWNERPDLQAAFNLATIAGRQGLSRWFIFHAFGEIGLIADNKTRAALQPWHSPWPGLSNLAAMPISWLMRAAGRREGFTAAQLHTIAGQQRLVSWYARVGIMKYGWISSVPNAQVEIMAELSEEGDYPRIFGWLWDDEPDVRARFNGPNDPALREWLFAHGGARWPVLTDPRLALARGDQKLPWTAYSRYIPVVDRVNKPSNKWLLPAKPNLPFGVNLIGHARGRLGIGEDVRMAVRALDAAKIPFSLRDVAVGSNVEVDDEISHLISSEMPYKITMFCTTGMEMVRAIGKMGQYKQEGRTVIGFWPWELPEFPALWHHAYAHVDEVWASSRYSHDAYARSAPVPVRHMPMAVCVNESAGKRRVDFGLPEKDFLYVYAYDALSRDSRKNPEACLLAFDRAFPRGDEPVGLVIKAHRGSESPAWQALRNRAAQDKRLFLIDESLPRGALLDLYRACDCFVSLHRAEGFGRNIAECMALGRPVIVTAHSGNMDFTRWDSAALVPVKLHEVSRGEYPYAARQIWAEPDIDAASWQMLRIKEDHVWRAKLIDVACARIENDYSPQHVGQVWATALRQIAGVENLVQLQGTDTIKHANLLPALADL